MSYLYVAGSAEGPVKIGFTANPRNRLNAIRNASPVHVDLLHCYRMEQHPEALEKTLHFVLDAKRLNGEWFNITAKEAFDALWHVATLAGVPLISDRPSPEHPQIKNANGANPIGRPPSGKIRVTMLMRPETVERFKATGKGWQARISDILDKNAP